MADLRLESTRVEWREVDDEMIALEKERSIYLAVNRSGTLLWRALSSGHTEPELAELLVEEYGIDLEKARADVKRFVDELQEQGLIRSTS